MRVRDPKTPRQGWKGSQCPFTAAVLCRARAWGRQLLSRGPFLPHVAGTRLPTLRPSVNPAPVGCTALANYRHHAPVATAKKRRPAGHRTTDAAIAYMPPPTPLSLRHPSPSVKRPDFCVRREIFDKLSRKPNPKAH